MCTVKIKILEEYKNYSISNLIPILENHYKNLGINELESLNRLIKRFKLLKDSDIAKFSLTDLFDNYPFFILTQTTTKQYLLFLRIITGDKKLY